MTFVFGIIIMDWDYYNGHRDQQVFFRCSLFCMIIILQRTRIYNKLNACYHVIL